jgi:hypothetical protein
MRALRNRLTYANVMSTLAVNGRVKRWIMGVVGVAALCLALGVTPGNSTPTQTTERIKHKGGFVGIGGSRVTFTVVVKEDGKPLRMKHIRFSRYPVFCSGVRDGTVSGFIPLRPMHGHPARSDGPLRGPGLSASHFHFVGKVKDDGNKATGEMRWRFVDSSGDRCDTGLHRWKTRG